MADNENKKSGAPGDPQKNNGEQITGEVESAPSRSARDSLGKSKSMPALERPSTREKTRNSHSESSFAASLKLRSIVPEEHEVRRSGDIKVVRTLSQLVGSEHSFVEDEGTEGGEAGGVPGETHQGDTLSGMDFPSTIGTDTHLDAELGQPKPSAETVGEGKTEEALVVTRLHGEATVAPTTFESSVGEPQLANVLSGAQREKKRALADEGSVYTSFSESSAPKPEVDITKLPFQSEVAEQGAASDVAPGTSHPEVAKSTDDERRKPMPFKTPEETTIGSEVEDTLVEQAGLAKQAELKTMTRVETVESRGDWQGPTEEAPAEEMVVTKQPPKRRLSTQVSESQASEWRLVKHSKIHGREEQRAQLAAEEPSQTTVASTATVSPSIAEIRMQVDITVDTKQQAPAHSKEHVVLEIKYRETPESIPITLGVRAHSPELPMKTSEVEAAIPTAKATTTAEEKESHTPELQTKAAEFEAAVAEARATGEAKDGEPEQTAAESHAGPEGFKEPERIPTIDVSLTREPSSLETVAAEPFHDEASLRMSESEPSIRISTPVKEKVRRRSSVLPPTSALVSWGRSYRRTSSVTEVTETTGKESSHAYTTPAVESYSPEAPPIPFNTEPIMQTRVQPQETSPDAIKSVSEPLDSTAKQEPIQVERQGVLSTSAPVTAKIRRRSSVMPPTSSLVPWYKSQPEVEKTIEKPQALKPERLISDSEPSGEPPASKIGATAESHIEGTPALESLPQVSPIAFAGAEGYEVRPSVKGGSERDVPCSEKTTKVESLPQELPSGPAYDGVKPHSESLEPALIVTDDQEETIKRFEADFSPQKGVPNETEILQFLASPSQGDETKMGCLSSVMPPTGAALPCYRRKTSTEENAEKQLFYADTSHTSESSTLEPPLIATYEEMTPHLETFLPSTILTKEEKLKQRRSSAEILGQEAGAEKQMSKVEPLPPSEVTFKKRRRSSVMPPTSAVVPGRRRKSSVKGADQAALARGSTESMILGLQEAAPIDSSVMMAPCVEVLPPESIMADSKEIGPPVPRVEFHQQQVPQHRPIIKEEASVVHEWALMELKPPTGTDVAVREETQLSLVQQQDAEGRVLPASSAGETTSGPLVALPTTPKRKRSGGGIFSHASQPTSATRSRTLSEEARVKLTPATTLSEEMEVTVTVPDSEADFEGQPSSAETQSSQEEEEPGTFVRKDKSALTLYEENASSVVQGAKKQEEKLPSDAAKPGSSKLEVKESEPFVPRPEETSLAELLLPKQETPSGTPEQDVCVTVHAPEHDEPLKVLAGVPIITEATKPTLPAGAVELTHHISAPWASRSTVAAAEEASRGRAAWEKELTRATPFDRRIERLHEKKTAKYSVLIKDGQPITSISSSSDCTEPGKEDIEDLAYQYVASEEQVLERIVTLDGSTSTSVAPSLQSHEHPPGTGTQDSEISGSHATRPEQKQAESEWTQQPLTGKRALNSQFKSEEAPSMQPSSFGIGISFEEQTEFPTTKDNQMAELPSGTSFEEFPSVRHEETTRESEPRSVESSMALESGEQRLPLEYSSARVDMHSAKDTLFEVTPSSLDIDEGAKPKSMRAVPTTKASEEYDTITLASKHAIVPTTEHELQPSSDLPQLEYIESETAVTEEKPKGKSDLSVLVLLPQQKVKEETQQAEIHGQPELAEATIARRDDLQTAIVKRVHIKPTYPPQPGVAVEEEIPAINDLSKSFQEPTTQVLALEMTSSELPADFYLTAKTYGTLTPVDKLTPHEERLSSLVAAEHRPSIEYHAPLHLTWKDMSRSLSGREEMKACHEFELPISEVPTQSKVLLSVTTPKISETLSIPSTTTQAEMQQNTMVPFLDKESGVDTSHPQQVATVKELPSEALDENSRLSALNYSESAHKRSSNASIVQAVIPRPVEETGAVVTPDAIASEEHVYPTTTTVISTTLLPWPETAQDEQRLALGIDDMAPEGKDGLVETAERKHLTPPDTAVAGVTEATDGEHVNTAAASQAPLRSEIVQLTRHEAPDATERAAAGVVRSGVMAPLEPYDAKQVAQAEQQRMEVKARPSLLTELTAVEESKYKHLESPGTRLTIEHCSPSTEQLIPATSRAEAVDEEKTIGTVPENKAQALMIVEVPGPLVDEPQRLVVPFSVPRAAQMPPALVDTRLATGTVEPVTQNTQLEEIEYPNTENTLQKKPSADVISVPQQHNIEMTHILSDVVPKSSQILSFVEPGSLSPTEQAQREQAFEVTEVPSTEVRSAGDRSSEGGAVLVGVEDVDEQHEYHDEVRQKRSTSIASLLKESPATIKAHLNAASSNPESPTEKNGTAVFEPMFRVLRSEEELQQLIMGDTTTDLSTVPEEVTKSFTDASEATIAGHVSASSKASAPDLQVLKNKEQEVAVSQVSNDGAATEKARVSFEGKPPDIENVAMLAVQAAPDSIVSFTDPSETPLAEKPQADERTEEQADRKTKPVVLEMPKEMLKTPASDAVLEKPIGTSPPRKPPAILHIGEEAACKIEPAVPETQEEIPKMSISNEAHEKPIPLELSERLPAIEHLPEKYESKEVSYVIDRSEKTLEVIVSEEVPEKPLSLTLREELPAIEHNQVQADRQAKPPILEKPEKLEEITTPEAVLEKRIPFTLLETPTAIEQSSERGESKKVPEVLDWREKTFRSSQEAAQKILHLAIQETTPAIEHIQEQADMQAKLSVIEEGADIARISISEPVLEKAILSELLEKPSAIEYVVKTYDSKEAPVELHKHEDTLELVSSEQSPTKSILVTLPENSPAVEHIPEPADMQAKSSLLEEPTEISKKSTSKSVFEKGIPSVLSGKPQGTEYAVKASDSKEAPVEIYKHEDTLEVISSEQAPQKSILVGRPEKPPAIEHIQVQAEAQAQRSAVPEQHEYRVKIPTSEAFFDEPIPAKIQDMSLYAEHTAKQAQESPMPVVIQPTIDSTNMLAASPLASSTARTEGPVSDTSPGLHHLKTQTLINTETSDVRIPAKVLESREKFPPTAVEVEVGIPPQEKATLPVSTVDAISGLGLFQKEPVSSDVPGRTASVPNVEQVISQEQDIALKRELTAEPFNVFTKKDQVAYLPSPEPTSEVPSHVKAEPALLSAANVEEDKVGKAVRVTEHKVEKVDEEKEALPAPVHVPTTQVTDSVSEVTGKVPQTHPFSQLAPVIPSEIDNVGADAPGLTESELAIAEALSASVEEAGLREQQRAPVHGIIKEPPPPQKQKAEAVTVDNLVHPSHSERVIDLAEITGTTLLPSETMPYAEFQKSLKAPCPTTLPSAVTVASEHLPSDHKVAVPGTARPLAQAEKVETTTGIEQALQLVEKGENEVEELAAAAVVVAAASAVVNAQQQREMAMLRESSLAGSMISATSEVPMAAGGSWDFSKKIAGDLDMLPSASRTALVAVLAAEPLVEPGISSAVCEPPSTISSSSSAESGDRLWRGSSRDRLEDLRVPEPMVPALDDEISRPRPTSFNVPVINIQYNFHFPPPSDAPGPSGRLTPQNQERAMAAQLLQGALAQQRMAGHIPGQHVLTPEQEAIRQITDRLNDIAEREQGSYTGRQSPARGTLFHRLPRKPVPPVHGLQPPEGDMQAQERRRLCGFRFIVCLIAFLMVVFILLYCLGLIGNKRYFLYYS
ncbi:hypothetical protein HPB51_006164 [Rhipicephalus microplus]|uniref:Uncharacterized protein n=1 Tax=Rhipicephalus microplus TaxID=6941 RepID=A0A9J6E6L9_RHIMP|nr:hypothetical protein HPB51_006164 [Rhipicephalus microplus]